MAFIKLRKPDNKTKLSNSSRFSFDNLLKGGLSILASFLLFASVASAGSLTPSAGAPSAQFFTLSQIYDFVAANTTATEGNHDFTFSNTLAVTGHTLTEIYNALANLIAADQIKLGTAYLGVTGTLVPNGGTAVVADLFNGKTANLTGDWVLDTGTLNLACNTATFDGTANLVATAYDGGGNGTNRWCMTDSGTAIAADMLSGKIAWVNGIVVTGTVAAGANVTGGDGLVTITIPDGLYTSSKTVTASDANLIGTNIKNGVNILGVTGNLAVGGYAYGDASAANVLTAAAGAGTYNAANLSTLTVKKGTTFGVGLTGSYSGYPGTGWTGGTPITQAACDAQNPTWYWFEDANGDGDTTDPEDGVCIKATTPASASVVSWNGATSFTAISDLVTQAATGGSANTIVKTGASWVANAYANEVVKITAGTAIGCWGVIKSNTTDTVTVYGSWLSSAYASNCGTPDGTSVFMIAANGFNNNDNTWIGDWTCAGTWPTGTVVWGSFPTSAKIGANTIALAASDCYDGVRDLLPTELSRAVVTGSATAADATSITDSAQTLNVNGWVGQKVLITGGTGTGGSGRIEANTATSITVAAWTGGTPDIGSTFAIIYLIPHADYNSDTKIDGDNDDQVNGSKGPLNNEVLKNWKGTRLPTAEDFYGFCGYKNGSGGYQNTTSANTANKTFGNFGRQVGRTDEFFDLANGGNKEWFSELQGTDVNIGDLVVDGGDNACSSANLNTTYTKIRFRAVFRP